MPSVSSEIITEITDHIRKFGGPFTAWCVGTARDWHSPILVAHQIEEKHDALICREAYTPGGGGSRESLARAIRAPKNIHGGAPFAATFVSPP